MIANVSKNNTGKLLVAVLAMFMIVAGAAVLFSEEASADAYSSADDLQKALNDAKETGSTVTVDDLLIIDKAIIIPDNVTLNIKSDQIRVNGGSITGGTITQSNHNGLAIASGSITGVKFTDFRMAISGMAGVNGNITITNCVFDSTGSTAPQSAIYIDGNAQYKYTISGCEFIGNYAQGTLNFDMRDGSKITADISESGNYSVGVVRGNLVMGETITYDGEITALNIATDASVTVPENYTLTVTGTIANNGTIYKNGTIVGEVTGNVIESGSIEISDASNSTTINNALNDANISEVVLTGGTLASTGVQVPADKTLVIESGVTISDNTTIKVVDDANIQIASTKAQTFSIENTTSTSAGTVNFIGVTGDYMITGGSIEITGNITGEIKGNGTADVILTGNLSGDIKMSWTGDNGNVTFEDATISSNCSITLVPSTTGAKLTYSVTGELRVYGKILNSTAGTDPISPISINVNGKNAVKAYASATIGNGVYFMGDGNIDLGSSMSTGYWSEDIASDMTWSQAQKTIIDGSMTIKSGYTLTVLGELIIDENVTVYIEDGAKLQIGNDTSTAVGITVNGTIEVAQGGTFSVVSAKDVTVTGQLYSEGIVDIGSNVTVKSGGSIVIDESYDETSASKITVTEGLTIEAGGSITISSEMTITEINNKGTVNLVDAILTGKSTIYQVADGAVVNIDSVTGSSSLSGTVELRVSDVRLVFETNKDTKEDDAVKDMVDDNVFSTLIGKEQGFGGLTITEAVTSEKVGEKTNYSNFMYLVGDIEAINEASDSPTFEFKVRGDGRNDGGLVIGAEDTLNLGEGVSMILNQSRNGNDGISTLTVEGTFTAVEADKQFKYEGAKTDVYVTGMITTKDEAIATYINSFHYKTTGTDGAHYYTTLATALANATQIDYYGDVEVLESVTVPSGVRITAASDATMTVGNADNRDVVLTVANGGVLRNGKEINVSGTLVFENNKDGNKGNTINSDVQIDENPKMTFTNVYTALNNATTGKVEIRQDADVILNSDIEVREGVTLVIPDSATVTMYNGVTLTVNGTVENSGSIVNDMPKENGSYVTGEEPAGFNPMKGDETNTDASKIVVNGAFKSMDYTAYDAYYIPGAYYQIIDTDGSWYWITPVEDAAAVAADVDDGIAIYGEVTVGDVTFAGSTEEGAEAVAITVNGKLTAGTITLNNATFTVPANAGQYNGTVATAVGSIEFVNVRNISVADTTDADDNEIMTLAKIPAKADLKGADATVAVATGNVTVVDGLTIETYDEEKNADGLKSFTVADAATVTVMDANGTQGELKADNLTVNGTLVAIDGGNVNVTGTLTVRGTFTVAEKTDDNTAGTASVYKLLIGIAVNDGKYGDASAAAVNADNIDKLASVVMSAESTFSGKQVESMKPTEFYLEDALWITAYAGTQADNIVTAATGSETSPTYNFQPADMNESKFVAWNDKDGKAITATTDVGQIDAVYADIQYDVFKVVITLDNTVGSVAIDGQMLVYDGELGGYVLPNDQLLTAGQHTVTYTLAANYEGTPTLSSQNVTVSGLTFTLSGDFENSNGKTINYYLSLGGATLADTSIVIDGGSGDDGMSLTDILLIVLVDAMKGLTRNEREHLLARERT